MAKKEKITAHWLILGTFIFVLLTDRGTKFLTKSQEFGQFNHGGVFGLFPGEWWTIFMLFVLGIVAFQIVRSETKLEQFSWTLILASGLSNLIDRILWGAVWDWIYYPIINIVGNWADILLGIAVIILLYSQMTSSSTSISNPE